MPGEIVALAQQMIANAHEPKRIVLAVVQPHMKIVIVMPKKLNLNLETLRLLNATDLSRVAGGKPPKTDLCTAGVCGTR